MEESLLLGISSARQFIHFFTASSEREGERERERERESE